jgi:type II secretory pathway pseudopilin PulG
MFFNMLIAIVVFGCLLAIAVMGFLKSNATAERLHTTNRVPQDARQSDTLSRHAESRLP